MQPVQHHVLLDWKAEGCRKGQKLLRCKGCRGADYDIIAAYRSIQDSSREDHGKLHVVSIRPANPGRRHRPHERELRALLLCWNNGPSPCQLSITCSCDTVTLYLCTPAYLVSIRLIKLIPHLSHAELQPRTVLLLIANFWTKKLILGVFRDG